MIVFGWIGRMMILIAMTKEMKAKTKALLREAQQYCDDNDKSTAFMLEYMQDVANVDLDCVLNYLEKEGGFKTIKK